ncbi:MULTISPECIES: alpha/beta hydrolase [unclassified Ensifer]|uniref:alpha/beta fold hydrolase n=1 Tax=unclassified Ensifer TaxID=2633371 RepID=UPI0008135470|nr:MULTISPECIES: alpha/beta hydrolase [unclassified Ensifer]OCP03036.1 alpha/beta hydrolase [Ensifer sp. LC14]OCP08172.1 alpha/beta hydrolase [Ensifer sp. LC11]OCP08845.1 alpha/beta hydrolase [Ensifer sp. LC13]OCP32214.1 alpha/beta hydrolase [Ensifer sp. LC499]
MFRSLKNFVATASVVLASADVGQALNAVTPAVPKIDFVTIDKNITLRRMVSHAVNPKGIALFLHGFPETLTVWKEIAGTLSKDYEVHAFDWPGYGQSSRPSPEQFSYSPRDYASVLKAYIDKSGVDRSNLVIYASDIGSLPALLLALDEPKIAKKIIVGDFAPFNRPHWMYESLQNLKAEPTATPTRAYMNRTSDEILQNVHRRGLAPEAQYELSSEVQADMKESWTHDGMTTADAFASYYAHFTRDEDYLEANLFKLKTPIKVIWGERDIYIKSEMGREFADRTHAEFDVLTGIGHFPHLQDPARTIDEVRAAFAD